VLQAGWFNCTVTYGVDAVGTAIEGTDELVGPSQGRPNVDPANREIIAPLSR
jgi:hypothetical protein